MRESIISALGGATMALWCATAAAQVPGTITYSAYIEDAATPIDGSIAAFFDLYSTDTGGTAVWSDTFALTAVGGYVVVDLTIPSMTFAGQPLWLEVTINGTVLAPRLSVGSVPYAFKSERTDLAQSLDWADSGNITAVEALAQGVAFDTTGELRAALDAVYIQNQSASPQNATLNISGAAVISGLSLSQTMSTSEVVAPAGNALRLAAAGSAAPHLQIDTSGRVGIGAASTGATLDVAGSIRVADGTQAAGLVLTADAAGNGSWQPSAAVPSGAVMFFNLPTCPAGWTELVAGRGRYLVGLTAAGTPADLATTVGSALGNLESRAVGQHGHGITDPGHSHTSPVRFSNGGAAAASSAGSTMPLQTSANTTGITVQNSGGVAGTNAPYVQLLVCQKT